MERLLSELASLNDLESYVELRLFEGNLYSWVGYIHGPEGTPYEGGIFPITIEFPENYPLSPPNFIFLTQIFHPNIRNDGKVCCEIFSSEKWKPSITIRALISYVIGLLNEPIPENGYEGEATSLCFQDKEAFDCKAREWTQEYASPKDFLLN